MKKITTLFALLFIASAACAGEQHGNKPQQPDQQQVNVKQSARAESTAKAKSSARSAANATGGNGTGGTGGNASSTGGTGTGGNATASGSQVTVNTGGGSGSGLTGRMVPDVSTTAPITSTSCRNGISAGGSGNGWGGLLGFFSEDDLCEWRLLEANYRATGDHDKANAIRSGMTAQRCKKLAPEDRESFGDLCPKQPAAEQKNVAFSSAG